MRRVLALLGLFVAAFLVFAVLALRTERGMAFVERRIEAFVPGLTIEGLEGVFRLAPRVRRVTLADARGVWLTAEDVAVDLAPTALLRRVARVEALEVGLLRVDRLPEGGAEPTPAEPSRSVLPSLPDLPVAVQLDRLALRRVELAAGVAGPQAVALALDGRAALGGGRLDGHLDLRRLDGDATATLDLALDPAQDRLAATLSAREAAGGLLPTLAGLPGQPFALDLRLDGPAAAGAALTLSGGLGPDVALSAQGTVRAAPDGSFGAALTGEARAAPLLPPQAAPLAVPLRFALDAALPAGGPLALRRLDLDLPAGRVGVTGTLDLAREAPDLAVTVALAESARFAALLPPAAPGLAWSAVDGTARVTGTLAAPRVALDAAAEGLATGIPQVDALLGPAPRLSGTVALPGPALDVTLEGTAARLAVEGTLAESGALTARLSLPRLAALGPGAEGAAEIEARVEGKLEDPSLILTARSHRIAAAGRVLEGLTLDARVETAISAPRVAARLDARLNGEPVRVAVRGRPEEGRLRLEEAEARLGAAARLSAEGALDTKTAIFDGTARMEAPDLAALGRIAAVPGLAGRLTLDARLAPRDGAQGFDATLDAPALGYGGTGVVDLRARAAGTPAALDWSLSGRGAPGGPPLGALSGRGAVATEPDGDRRVDLAALEVEAAGERLRLAAPARVVLGAAGGVALPAPGLTITAAGGGRLTAAGRWGPDRADLTATLGALPLSLAARFAPEVQPQGTLSGEVRITGAAARPDARATIQATNLRAGAAWAQGLPPLSLRAEATVSGGESAQARAELDAGAGGRITATARLPNGFGADATIAATADGSITLAPLLAPFLAAGADRVTGRVALALRADGPLTAPRLGGRATLSGVEYRNPVTGVRVADIVGTLAGEGTRLVVERIQGRTAGGGTVAVQGSVDLGAPGFPADLTLTARNARPVTSDLITATLNADLRLNGPVTAPGGTLSGTVTVLSAEIRIPENLPSSVATLPNVRTVGTPPPGAIPPPRPAAPARAARRTAAAPRAANAGRPGRRGAPPAAAAAAAAAPPPASPAGGLPPLGLGVTVLAPRGVFVRGRGVDAELGGEVRIGGTLAQPVPSGELTLRYGTLDVLARRLTFQRGTIGFTTGTSTPTLNLSATSQVGATTITVSVTGTPAAPVVTFTSVPELPQDEVLARLLFGRPTSSLSPFEIAQIAQAIGQLTGIGTGDGVLDRLRTTLGLDRLGVTSDAQGRSAVEAGRYVAPGVFLGVRQGVEGQTGVGVQVELTPRLRLEGQTATGPAGDRVGVTYEYEY